MNAVELFAESLARLRQQYSRFRFFAERDLVWTVQLMLLDLIAEQQLSFQVFNDYPMLPGTRRSLSADLVILDQDEAVQVAAEFKYEPDHRRRDILPGKLPVVDWGQHGVGRDMERIRQFVAVQKCPFACAILVDEGGFFRRRPPYPGSEWRAWEHSVQVLYAEVRA